MSVLEQNVLRHAQDVIYPVESIIQPLDNWACCLRAGFVFDLLGGGSGGGMEGRGQKRIDNQHKLLFENF